MNETKPPSPRRWIGPAIITGFLLVAVVIGLTPRGPRGNFIQSSEFQIAMDRAATGATEPLPGRLAMKPTGTFRATDARWCRSYALSGSLEGSGIVCRTQGEWLSEARSDVRDSDGALAAARYRLGAQTVALDAEAALLAAQWRSNTPPTPPSPRT